MLFKFNITKILSPLIQSYRPIDYVIENREIEPTAGRIGEVMRLANTGLLKISV